MGQRECWKEEGQRLKSLERCREKQGEHAMLKGGTATRHRIDKRYELI